MQLLAISRTVKEGTDNNDDTGDVNLAGVIIQLLDSNFIVIKTTIADTDGNYKFDNLVPDEYVVTKTNLDGFADVKDTNGGDLNRIMVNLVSTDSVENDFVDKRPESPSSSPSIKPSPSPSKMEYLAVSGNVKEDTATIMIRATSILPVTFRSPPESSLPNDCDPRAALSEASIVRSAC